MQQQKIIKLISKGETEKGMDLILRSEIENFPSHKQAAIILLSSRINSLKKKYHLGLLTAEQYEVEQSKVSLDLLYLIKTLKENNFTGDSKEKALEPKSLEGTRVGNYEILKFLGAGGFGNVYLAKQVHLHSVYAIKISHEIKVGREYLDNIISVGISSLKSLKHRNVITVHDVGEIEIDSNPRIYIVMDYIKGGTLDELAKSDLSKEAINNKIAIFRKVCLAIEAAHKLVHHNRFGFEIHGLYHGDIKPQNILMEEQNEPIVIDFMFVDMNSLYEIIVNTPEKINNSTAAFGTPGYMPFEQAQNGLVNKQTDIYALGILLFEIFTSIRFSDLREITESSIRAHLKEANPNIPNYVSKIVYNSTRKAPSERYKTVGGLLGDLGSDQTSWWRKLLKK
jgi:serine/threonine-protein kinase